MESFHRFVETEFKNLSFTNGKYLPVLYSVPVVENAIHMRKSSENMARLFDKINYGKCK